MSNIINREYFNGKNNPWHKYSKGESIIVEDIEVLKNCNAGKSKKNILNILYNTYFGEDYADSSCDNKFKKYKVLDSPINGNPFVAKIILLYNNPALPNKKGAEFSPKNKLSDYFEDEQKEIIANNLNLSNKAKLLYTEETLNKNNDAQDWYLKIYNKFKENLKSEKEYSLNQFKRDVCTLQWFPYPTKSLQKDFIANNLNECIKKLPTHEFMVDLARYAIYSGKTVIAMRSVKRWEEALSFQTISDEGKSFEGNDRYVNNYENNFFMSLDNINPGPKEEYLVRPLIKKVYFRDFLKEDNEK